MSLFTTDVVSSSDGGGVAGVLAARTPVRGDARVAQFVTAFASHFWSGARLTRVEANGMPAVLLTRGEAPYTLLTATATPSGIAHLYWVMNPHKLNRFSAR